MFPSEQRAPVYEKILSRLAAAEWIRGFDFTPGQGYRLDWTSAGRQRVLLLQELIRARNLEEWPVLRDFTVVSFAQPHGDDAAESNIRDFWRTSLEELSVAPDENSLKALVEVIAAWRPAAVPGG